MDAHSQPLLPAVQLQALPRRLLPSPSALQRRVSCLVDLLMVQVAACGEGRQLFDDGLHAYGGGEVFLRLEGVAQDVATGAGHLADDLQVHAGPPLPQHLDVVLPHHRVVFVPPRGQAALPAAGKLLLGRPEPSARLGGVRNSSARVGTNLWRASSSDQSASSASPLPKAFPVVAVGIFAQSKM